MFKKISLAVFMFVFFYAVFLLLSNYSNAQDVPEGVVDQEDVLYEPQSTTEEPILAICEPYVDGSMNREESANDYKYTLKFFVEINTKERCSVRAEAYTYLRGKTVNETNRIEVAYFQNTGDKRELCQTGTDPEAGTLKPFCYPYPEHNKAATIPSSGGWSEKTDLPEPIIIKKGEYYENDFSKELINLLDPQDQLGPYTFSLNTMGGFPPMGLMLWSNGVLKGTPIGKDSHFEACVINVSGRKVCKVLNIKLERDKSDKPEFNIIESIKSSFEPAKFTKINHQDLVYGERGQIKSGIHERIAIVMKDGSIVEMDKNSTLTPNSEYELTTNIGKFKFNYEKFLGPNSFCAFESLLSELCRQVNTPNGTIRIKGTQFMVENDSSGTSIAVIEGTVLVSDTKNKKEIEINKGQFAFLKDGILSEDPQSFELGQLDRWWEEKGTERSDGNNMTTAMLIVFGIVVIILLIVIMIKKFRKKI